MREKQLKTTFYLCAKINEVEREKHFLSQCPYHNDQTIGYTFLLQCPYYYNHQTNSLFMKSGYDASLCYFNKLTLHYSYCNKLPTCIMRIIDYYVCGYNCNSKHHGCIRSIFSDFVEST